MKSIQTKALVTLLVISMSLCASLNREKSTTKTKVAIKAMTKDVGSGSWSAGYDCPDMIIQQFQPSSLPEIKLGAYKFNPSQMSKWKDGLELEINAADALSKEVFVTNAPGGKIYIPWRYIDENDVEYSKDTLSFKKLTFKVVTDSNKGVKITMLMPYATIGNYIEASQVNDIKDFIIKSASEAKNKILAAKRSLNSNVQELKVCLDNKIKITQDAAKIKAAALAENEKIKASLQTKGQQLETLKAQIQTKTSEISALVAQRDSLSDDVSRFIYIILIAVVSIMIIMSFCYFTSASYNQIWKPIKK